MQPIHLIVYSSVSLIPPAYADREVARIVARSIEQNGLHGITGALLHSEGRQFAQALEGDEAAVAMIMQKISRDTRHSRIMMLHDGPVSRRRFTNWSLAFRGERSAVDYAISDAEAAATQPSDRALNLLLRIMEDFAAVLTPQI